MCQVYWYTPVILACGSRGREIVNLRPIWATWQKHLVLELKYKKGKKSANYKEKPTIRLLEINVTVKINRSVGEMAQQLRVHININVAADLSLIPSTLLWDLTTHVVSHCIHPGYESFSGWMNECMPSYLLDGSEVLVCVVSWHLTIMNKPVQCMTVLSVCQIGVDSMGKRGKTWFIRRAMSFIKSTSFYFSSTFNKLQTGIIAVFRCVSRHKVVNNMFYSACEVGLRSFLLVIFRLYALGSDIRSIWPHSFSWNMWSRLNLPPLFGNAVLGIWNGIKLF